MHFLLLKLGCLWSDCIKYPYMFILDIKAFYEMSQGKNLLHWDIKNNHICFPGQNFLWHWNLHKCRLWYQYLQIFIYTYTQRLYLLIIPTNYLTEALSTPMPKETVAVMTGTFPSIQSSCTCDLSLSFRPVVVQQKYKSSNYIHNLWRYLQILNHMGQ